MRSVARSGTTQGCPSTIEREDMSVNRTELIAAISEKAGLTNTDADAFLVAFQDVLV